jgi:hypothetical protein
MIDLVWCVAPQPSPDDNQRPTARLTGKPSTGSKICSQSAPLEDYA